MKKAILFLMLSALLYSCDNSPDAPDDDDDGGVPKAQKDSITAARANIDTVLFAPDTTIK